MPEAPAYAFTHITWRKRNTDGTVSNYVHTIPDRERAADDIAELIINPDVFAVRAIDYPQADPDVPTSHDRIGPPVTA